MNARLSIPVVNDAPRTAFASGAKLPSKTAAMIEAQEERRNRPRDVALLHAMQAARPLKPPPHNFGPRRSTAAAVEARADYRRGMR